MEIPDRIGGADPYERLARKGLAAYGLSDARISRASRKEKVVFTVIDDGPEGRAVYALRICSRDESRKQLIRESLLLEEIRRSTDLPVPEPVLTRRGELVRSLSTPGVSGFRPVCLFRWVSGRPLPIGDWTIDISRAVGRLIGEIHRATEGFSWPYELSDDQGENPITQLPTSLSPSETGDLERIHGLAQEASESLTDDPSARGPIHGNLLPEHVLFRSGSLGAIGFSSCRKGYYLYDIATLAIGLDEPLRKGLLAGYMEVREIDPEKLPGFIALRRLELLGGTR